MKPKTIVVVMAMVMVAGCAFAQAPPSRLKRPSDAITAPLPARDVVLTLHLSSDQSTVLEKERIDACLRGPADGPLDETGRPKCAPVNATISDHLIMVLEKYLREAMERHPSDAIAEARKAADTAAAVAKASKDGAAKIVHE